MRHGMEVGDLKGKNYAGSTLADKGAYYWEMGCEDKMWHIFFSMNDSTSYVVFHLSTPNRHLHCNGLIYI